MWVSTGVRQQETPGQELPGREAGRGLPGTGRGADIETWRWHGLFREQHTGQLGREAGGEGHKEVVVKSWLAKGMKEEGYQRCVEPRDKEQGLEKEVTRRAAGATPSTKPRPA